MRNQELHFGHNREAKNHSKAWLALLLGSFLLTPPKPPSSACSPPGTGGLSPLEAASSILTSWEDDRALLLLTQDLSSGVILTTAGLDSSVPIRTAYRDRSAGTSGRLCYIPRASTLSEDVTWMLRGHRDVSDRTPALEEQMGRYVLEGRTNKPAVTAQGVEGSSGGCGSLSPWH